MNQAKRLLNHVIQLSKDFFHYVRAERERRAIAYSIGLHVGLLIAIIIFSIVYVSHKPIEINISPVSSKPVVQAQMISAQQANAPFQARQKLLEQARIIREAQRQKIEAQQKAEEQRQRQQALEQQALEQKKAEEARQLALAKAKERRAEQKRKERAQRQAEAERKQKKLVEQKQQQEKARQQAEAKRLEKQKRAEALTQKRAAERLKKLAMAGLSNQAESQQKAMQSAERQGHINQEIAKYVQAIKQKVQSNWNNPFKGSLHATVHLVLGQSGQVLSTNIVSSSGNRQFDTQLLLAIQKSSPLPLPQGEEARDKMLDVNLVFNNS